MRLNNKSKDFIEKKQTHAGHPKPDEENEDTVLAEGGGPRTTPSNAKPQKLKWQSLADAGHPKHDKEENEDVSKIPKQSPRSSILKEKKQGRPSARSSALSKKYAFHDMVMERVRQAYPRRSSNEVAPTDIEVLTWWNNLLNGIESSPSGAGSSEDQSLATSEEMETLRAMSVDEIDQMAQQFLQDGNSEEEKEEEGHNFPDFSITNQVSARDVIVVSGENNEGNDNVDRQTVVTGFLVVDRKVLQKPIYTSVPWITPLCLLITGSLLLVIILVVSLSVVLTNTGQPGIFSTTIPPPTLSLSPTISATFRPSSLLSLRPSFSPSDHPTDRPSVSASPTALPTVTPVMWSQVGTGVTGTRAEEQLGSSVALSANGNVLGAAGNGVLRVYLLTGMDDWSHDWILSKDLSSSITGWSTVAFSLDGSAMVVSDAYFARVMVYRRIGADWEQRVDLLDGLGYYAICDRTDDKFGESLAVSSNGTVVVVGAPGGDYVDVYRDEEGENGNLALVTRIEGDSRSYFGDSVATSADATRLIVGAPCIDDRTGAVFVYSLFPEHTLLQRMDGNEIGDWFGKSVDVSSNGGVFAVGVGNERAGYVKVYAADDSSQQQYSLLADRIDGPASSAFGKYGLSLSANGARLAVGARYDSQNGPSSGSAFVYAVHPRRHQKIGEFVGDAPMIWFGSSVSLSEDGTRLAVGAYRRNVGSDFGGYWRGLVSVFESA